MIHMCIQVSLYKFLDKRILCEMYVVREAWDEANSH